MAQKSGFQVSGNSAELYQRFVVPNYTAPWARGLVEAADIKRGDRVLDVACGTGVVTRIASEIVGNKGEVIGLDVNATMLDVARSVPVTESNISWIEKDVADTGLEADTFDVVLSQQGIQYFPDKDAAVRELFRVLVPGGQILMSVWKGHSAFSTAQVNAVERHISSEWADKVNSQRTPPALDDICRVMDAAGFTDVSTTTQELEMHLPLPRDYVPQHLSAMPVAVAFSALNETDREAFLSQMEEELQGFVQGEQVVVPDAVYLISGRK